MRVKKTNVLAALATGLALTMTAYVILEGGGTGSGNEAGFDGLTKQEVAVLEDKLRALESKLQLNQKTIDKIKETVNDIKLKQTDLARNSKAIRAKGRSSVNKTFASISKADLGFAAAPPTACDIDMAQIYEELPFDNPDGGVWKQGWEVSYKKEDFEKEKLRIFVMPHSHNDPGWIKTFEDYYATQTKHILSNMVTKLKEDPRRKFVWAEISFLALWWSEQTARTQKEVKDMLKNGQLEILTGGWVMNDEANTFYYAMIEQLFLGHEWCEKNLDGYKPNNGWAIDPFGLSSTMAYLLKRMGMDNMLIQRTHYSVKKRLAESRDLEFMWRQHWDHGQTTEILTHMMPFYSYDVPHTCGPDPKICCQFDFARLPGGRFTCPWMVPPKAINEANVGERASLILDQWRKKSTLFKSNVLLVPLGDDFRYQTVDEIDKQFTNYQKIFDHINSSPEMNAEASFGTLQDYFTALRQESTHRAKSETGMFKSLKGDFFTYCDREDNYWSGYYTSRPFYKSMDRILEGYLRAAEILFSMAWAEMEYVGSDVAEISQVLMNQLVVARQHLSLFQHHDGVTGTAKNHVVVDYGNKMLEAIRNCQNVMSASAHYLLSTAKAFYKTDPNEKWFDLDDFRESHDSVPRQTVIQDQDKPVQLVIFNSHGKKRVETVTIKVADPKVRMYTIIDVDGDDEEDPVPIQISPVFDNEGQMSNTEYEISFLASVKALSLKTYHMVLLRPEEGSNPDSSVATIKIHNSATHPFQAPPFEEPEVYEAGDDFSLQNGYVRADFDPNGMLKAVTTLDDGITTKAHVEMITYSTPGTGDRSGAYLFMPDGDARVLTPENPLVRIVEGKIISYVEVFTPWMVHRVILKSSPGPDGTGVEIRNDVDIRKMSNTEVGMRISTDLESGDEFFTDLNGFQMIRRKRMLEKLPLQANYYPVPSMMYIQDPNSRVTLVSRQPLGGSSLKPGQIEILMDRRLSQDDNRGLSQGVQDNKVTPHLFYLTVERKMKGCQSDEPASGSQSYPSLLALQIRHGLINPLYRLIYSSKKMSPLNKSFEPVEQDLPCDIEMVSLRTLPRAGSGAGIVPSDEAALMLHRQGFNPCYKPIGMTCVTNGGKISVLSLFPELYGEQMKQTSLTKMYDGLAVQKGFTVSINPMEIYTFILKR